MTSKISFNKFLKENIRQRSWLVALSCILLLLSGTVYTVMSLDSNIRSCIAAGGSLYDLAQDFPIYLNGSNRLLFAVIFILAILCAVSGYSYLHSAEKTDFFHGLPLTRTQWFLISYTGGLLIFAVPYLLNGLCTILAGTFHGLMNGTIFLTCCYSMFRGILGFLVCYHVTIFAMMLTGKIVTGVLASLVLMVYTLMLGTLTDNLVGCFFHTYCGSGQSLSDRLTAYLSPMLTFAGLQTMDFLGRRSIFSGNVSLFLTTFFMLTFFLLAAWILYRNRPSESAGNALAFSKTASVIKIMIAIPCALYIGIFATSLFGGFDTKWCIIISILSVILLCGIIEYIYQQDLRQLFKRKWSSLASILGVIGILCILQFDLFGYDSWIPEKSQLESMSFHTTEFYNYFNYPAALEYPAPNFVDEMKLKNFDTLYALAEEGIVNEENGIYPDNTIPDLEHDDYITVTIAYHSTSGKETSRNYSVKRESAQKVLSEACQEESYRKALFPIFYLDETSITSISLSDIYYQPVNLNLTDEQQQHLLEAYKKDVLTVDVDTLQNKIPLGELSVTYSCTPEYGPEDSYITNMPLLYVYDSYENTLAVLDKYDYGFRTEIAPEDVIYMNLISADEAELAGIYTKQVLPDTVSEQQVSVTAKDDIEKILSRIHYSCTGILGGQNKTVTSVEIMLKGTSTPSYYPVWEK